jgi:DNA-binding NtrC family response regulator
VKLLRVLQSNEIQRVGSDQVIKVDARIVAATNRRLLDLCAEGAFREDLYYRLSIIQVTLPPLRERRDEIPLLIDFLTQEAAARLAREPIRLSRRLDTFLKGYDYPGNIRELRNILFRLTCLAGEEADLEHLPDHVRPDGAVAAAASKASASGEAEVPEDASLADAKRIASDYAEKRFLEAGLLATGGNVTKLAKRIDMNRAHVQTLLKKHGLSSKDFRGTAGNRAGSGAQR